MQSEMLKWLRLAVWLLLSAAVSGREVECDHVDGYIFRCWNSPTHDFVVCWGCTIYNQQISELEVSIAPKHRNGTDFDVELVLFSGGDLTKMPKVIHKNTEKQIFNVGLRRTNNRVLNAQFFGNGAQHLVNFQSQYNDILSVEASAFRNCAALEALGLDDNGISTISSDAFRGLHKLVWLNLDSNKLTAINENLFDDLGNLEVLNLSKNQLTEITDTAFKNLPKLKKLLLDHNKVEIVTRRMFQHNLKLQEIYLQYNQLRVIQSRSFAHLGKLSWLYLHKNKCTNNDFQDTNPEEILAALAGCLPTICLIPLIPNGYIVSAEDNAPQTVGDSSEEYKPVKVVCLPSFLLFHDKETQPNNSCVDDNWTNEKWPECYR